MYLVAAILIGMGSTHNVGEKSPSLDIAGDISYKELIVLDTYLTTAKKIETNNGWASKIGIDVFDSNLGIGIHWTHRETSKWSKDRLFLRALFRANILKLIFEIAPDSNNKEIKGEARLRFKFPVFGTNIILEPRYFLESHNLTPAIGYGYGVSIFAGLSW